MIRKLIRRIIHWASSEHDSLGFDEPYMSNYANCTAALNKIPGNIEDLNNGLHLTMFNAVGGKIIQFHTHDLIKDRTVATLYIITDKEDLGEELGQILTRESLSR